MSDDLNLQIEGHEMASGSKRSEDIIMPEPSEPFDTFADSYLDASFLARGAIDLLNYAESVNGQLSQAVYELIRDNALTPDTLRSHSDKYTSLNADSRVLFLQRRYYVDPRNIVRDRRKQDKVVVEPRYIYNVIINVHLLNDHMGNRTMHKHIIEHYSNITRDMVIFATRYCTKCNPSKQLATVHRYKHKNFHEHIMPLERVQIEVFQPFADHELIERRFSHVLYARDFNSRFTWIEPLKNTTFKHLLKALTKLILQFIRIPIYLESATMEKQDLFDLLEIIASKFELRIGIGQSNSVSFLIQGIKRMKHLLERHKGDCIAEWNMCLYWGPNFHNKKYNSRVQGFPSEKLCHDIKDCDLKYRTRRKVLLENTFAHKMLKPSSGNGCVFWEYRTTFSMGDDDEGNYDDDIDASDIEKYTNSNHHSLPEKDNTNNAALSTHTSHHELLSGTMKRNRRNQRHEEKYIADTSERQIEDNVEDEIEGHMKKRMKQSQDIT